MEDARNEFQVFLSPTRTGMENMSSANTQRVIPVVSKAMNVSNSPFLLTQRRSSVYKAVSGISFQESDEKKRTNKKDKSNFKRERSERRSIVMHERYAKNNNETRRSKSLTSIGAQINAENEYNENSVPEFIHPFSPTAIQNRLGRHDKSVRARKRASSQSRHKTEMTIYNGSNASKTEPPQPPRRARSASRCRKHGIRLADEIASKQNRSNSLDSTADVGFIVHRDNSYNKLDVQKTVESESMIDFDVNATDWKTYDKIISEKLNTLLKAKEEPEGGYFSLERDECEEPNEIALGVDNSFQQDYYNESIYISQTLDQVDESQVDQIQNLDYSCANSTLRESHDPDDEGLYEEIYFENSDAQSPVDHDPKTSHGLSYQPMGLPCQLMPIHDRVQGASRIKQPPRIEQGPTGTVVYITSNSSPTSSYKSNVSSSDSNQLTMMDDFLKSKRNIFTEQMNSTYLLSKDSARNGRQNKKEKVKNFTKNGTHICQNNRVNKFMTKVTLPVGSDIVNFEDKSTRENKLYNLSISENAYSRRAEPAVVVNATKKIKPPIDMKKSKSSGSFEKDFELSDLDFDMFTPKDINQRKKRHTRAGDSTEYEKSLLKLQQLQFKFSQYEDKLTISHPPNTFQAFLHNSVFNPPEGESFLDEPLVIKEDQVITCITDSSSDETDCDSDNSTSSPWLEASKDFEYVAFQDKAPPKSTRRRKKGMAHLTNMLNLPFPNNSSQSKDGGQKQSNIRYLPQRPSRSKHRNRSKI